MLCIFLYRFVVCFFFFKQKTAYELRISDWSSDVCSSDLGHARREVPRRAVHDHRRARSAFQRARAQRVPAHPDGQEGHRLGGEGNRRSEEHTSELQSLMRISYAVFCLKKKNQQEPEETHTNTD